MKEQLRILLFVLISASAGIVQALTDTICKEIFMLPAWVCYLLALVLSVLWNFTINRKYTFRSDASVPRAMLLVALYYCVFAPLTIWDTYYFVDVLGWNNYIILGVNMLLNLSTEYLYQRFVVYRGMVDNTVKKVSETH